MINVTQGFLDILKNLSKRKARIIAEGILNSIDEDNVLRNVIITQVKRNAIVHLLFQEEASGNIIGAVFTSSSEALKLVKDIVEAGIDRVLLNKVMRIILDEPSINTQEVISVFKEENINISSVDNIREISIAPSNETILFSCMFIIHDIDSNLITNDLKLSLANSILNSYNDMLNLNMETNGIYVKLIDENIKQDDDIHVVSEGNEDAIAIAENATEESSQIYSSIDKGVISFSVVVSVINNN